MSGIEQEVYLYVALLAGSDTTLIWFRTVLYCLMKNPPSVQDIQEGIDTAFEEGRLNHPINYADSIKLPLLCATLKEALRIHPGV